MVEQQEQEQFEQQMPDGGDENQLMDELRRLEQSARNYQQEVSLSFKIVAEANWLVWEARRHNPVIDKRGKKLVSQLERAPDFLP